MGSKSKSSTLTEPPAKRSKSSKSSKSDKSDKPDKPRKSSKPAKEKRHSKPTKTDAEKAASKEAYRAARAEARAAKRREAESDSDDDDEEEGEDERQADPADANDNDVMEDVQKEGKTQKEIEDAAKKLAKLKAKRRGYRTVANRGGFSAYYDSGYAHLDVATPILSEGEVKRAAKWAPKMEQHAAYGNLTEFAERTQLSLEPLPPAAVRVIRGYAEPFLRRLVMGAFQRASDQQKTGIKIAEVVAETRPLQRVLKYSFVAPHGLIRFAQNDNNGGERLQHSPDDKSEEVLSEEKTLLKLQKAKLSELKKGKAQKEAEKAEIRAEKKERAAAALAAATGTA